MLKLYRLSDVAKEYWETWEDDGSHVVHFGELGTRGTFRPVKGRLFRSAVSIIQKEIDTIVAQGFAPLAMEDHAVLMIEYSINGMGDAADIEKRHALENRMNETLGWTGLGACDGGSIGSGSMEVCNFVVDFDVARRVIEADLADTEFANFTRIYREN